MKKVITRCNIARVVTLGILLKRLSQSARTLAHVTSRSTSSCDDLFLDQLFSDYAELFNNIFFAAISLISNYVYFALFPQIVSNYVMLTIHPCHLVSFSISFPDMFSNYLKYFKLAFI